MVPCPVWVKKTNSQQNGAGLGFLYIVPVPLYGDERFCKAPKRRCRRRTKKQRRGIGPV
jgi:hypothetical protein